jgi:hypothetical protein
MQVVATAELALGLEILCHLRMARNVLDVVRAVEAQCLVSLHVAAVTGAVASTVVLVPSRAVRSDSVVPSSSDASEEEVPAVVVDSDCQKYQLVHASPSEFLGMNI